VSADTPDDDSIAAAIEQGFVDALIAQAERAERSDAEGVRLQQIAERGEWSKIRESVSRLVVDARRRLVAEHDPERRAEIAVAMTEKFMHVVAGMANPTEIGRDVVESRAVFVAAYGVAQTAQREPEWERWRQADEEILRKRPFLKRKATERAKLIKQTLGLSEGVEAIRKRLRK